MLVNRRQGRIQYCNDSLEKENKKYKAKKEQNMLRKVKRSYVRIYTSFF
jgi:hypothetical protein